MPDTLETYAYPGVPAPLSEISVYRSGRNVRFRLLLGLTLASLSVTSQKDDEIMNIEKHPCGTVDEPA